MRLARINVKYQKDELQMKSHMMTALSNEYERVIVKFRGDLNDTTIQVLNQGRWRQTHFGIDIGRFYIKDTLEEVQGNLQELQQDWA